MSDFVCTRRVLCDFFINSGTNNTELQKYLIETFGLSLERADIVIASIRKNLLSKFNDRWQKWRRTKDLFENANSAWLDGEFRVIFAEITAAASSGERGRPSKPYGESSEKTKKRKNMEIVQEYGFEFIHNAYVQHLRSIGELDEASIVSIARTLPKKDKKEVLKKMTYDTETVTTYSKDEALCIYIDLDLTKSQYGLLRSRLSEKNIFVFPSYNMILDAKKMCYPPRSSIEINDIGASIKLKDLLDHTVARILQINSVHKSGHRNLKLYVKWGCDGSSGQSEYKQALPDETQLISDANLFIASLVPIKLIDLSTNLVVWQNTTCSSVRYCRPISIKFVKETPQQTRETVDDIKRQIDELTPSLVNKDDEVVEVKHELFLTMIDGKVAQVLTNTSSSAVCTICGARPREMNDLSKVSAKPENEDAFQYGLSTLHAWIRFMETILHISYNISFMKWSATTEENKKSKEEKKKSVQSKFRNELGLHIDKPRQGAGNSNDGNTARRFFSNYHCSANITGVDEELIKRLYIILQTLSSGIAVNAFKFGQYAMDTARIFVNKYNWYYMPSSLHKILIHGESVIRHFAILPIGQMSEDAQEARNKDYRRYRLHHSRKCSRSATNEDVFHSLLFTSDPYISSLRAKTDIVSRDLLFEAKVLLDLPESE